MLCYVSSFDSFLFATQIVLHFPHFLLSFTVFSAVTRGVFFLPWFGAYPFFLVFSVAILPLAVMSIIIASNVSLRIFPKSILRRCQIFIENCNPWSSSIDLKHIQFEKKHRHREIICLKNVEKGMSVISFHCKNDFNCIYKSLYCIWNKTFQRDRKRLAKKRELHQKCMHGTLISVFYLFAIQACMRLVREFISGWEITFEKLHFSFIWTMSLWRITLDSCYVCVFFFFEPTSLS